ncbi:MAG: cysteine--tRNA ligase [Gemmatimonadota bacterium]
MALRFYNTLSRSLQEFEPLNPGRAGVYACGPTVYRPPHIGNFRTFVFNDLLHRYLEFKGHDVRFVMNLTDVEDKIIAGAAQQKTDIGSVTAPMIDAFMADLSTVGVLPADSYPRATDHIDDMVGLIERLVERKHAYVADGSVYFAIGSLPDYGKLSRIELEDVKAGAGLATRARAVDADEYGKEDARDFALWKAARPEDLEVKAVWSTPWGDGRPGWHIECSAMSMVELGETFDIHTGGEDLIFPHHEDEIAQSEAATGKPFARYWLHVKHLLVNGEKMSKSKQNDFTIDQLIEKGYSGAAIRYLLLSAHYRKELNFTFDGLEQGRESVRRLLNFAERVESATIGPEAGGLAELAEQARAGFEAAFDDDLNTSAALAVVFDFVRETNAKLDAVTSISEAESTALRSTLDAFDRVLGVLTLARKHAIGDDQEFTAWVDQKIAERQAARARRDFAAADRIRVELTEKSVILEDTPAGPRWKRA